MEERRDEPFPEDLDPSAGIIRETRLALETPIDFSDEAPLSLAVSRSTLKPGGGRWLKWLGRTRRRAPVGVMLRILNRRRLLSTNSRHKPAWSIQDKSSIPTRLNHHQID
jgi:hypothetical protein